MSEKERKTTRKNKTNQMINWPPSVDYFTIDNLILTNEHMLTNSGSDITLRVRLMKAVKEEPKTVAVIGTTNLGKGRPQLVFAVRPVKQSVVDKAVKNKIMLVSETELIPVMEISKPSTVTTPTIIPVKVTETQTVTA
jgi:hypothetical protein